MIKQLKVALSTNPPLKMGVIAILIAELFLLALLLLPLGQQNTTLLEFDKKIGLAMFTGLPLFLFAVLQLYVTSVVQRANYIRELASRLHTEPNLSETFFYLVYTYSNELYQEFKDADEEKRKSMQSARDAGQRLYVPDQFQCSEEERRLDALLSYFDIIAYHYHRNVIRMEDIFGVLGFHLAALSTRDVIEDYRHKIPAHWLNSSFTEEFETVAPYQYLTILLKDFKKYCIEHKDKISELNKLTM